MKRPVALGGIGLLPVPATRPYPARGAVVAAGLLAATLLSGSLFVGVSGSVAASDGKVVAWGDNGWGETTVPTDAQSGVVAIAGGAEHSLALKSDGTVVAWGTTAYGATSVPSGLSGVVAVAAGSGSPFSLALTSGGAVVAWGDNSYGATTVPATAQSGVTAISAGYGHALALKSDGTVVAWGWDLYGQTNVPAGLTGVTAIAAGATFSLAMKSDGTVVAWGDNAYGETSVPSGLSGVTAIAAGWEFSLVLKSDGTVGGWGAGPYLAPAGLTGVTAITAGVDHALALKSDGTVVAWGNDNAGQVDVPIGLTGVTAIAAGANSSLALAGTSALNAQKIAFPSTAPGATVGGATYTPTATASSGLPVTLTIDSSAATVCEMSGNGVVSFVGAGTCVIDANQSGDANYYAAYQVQQSFSVGPPALPQPPPGASAPNLSGPLLTPNPADPGSTTYVYAIAASTYTVQSADLQLDGGLWTPMSASDGNFDTGSEWVTGTFSAPAAGAHTVCVRATDSLGQTSIGVCRALTVPAQTPVGSNVAVPLAYGGTSVTATFSSVTGAGATTLTTSASAPAVPAGFVLDSPTVYYDITTTATYSPPITVCISYAGMTPTPTSLLHYDSVLGSWADVTTSIDTGNKIICGITASLSPFVLASVVQTCTATGLIRDGTDLTAAIIDPTDPVTGTVDATGCNIGVYFGSGASGSVHDAEIFGANYYGVVANAAAVDVTNANIHDIGETPLNGSQHGVGVLYTTVDQAGDTTGPSATGTLSGTMITNYQKNGVVVSGAGAAVQVLDNTVTGQGPIDWIAQNGIQVSYGATALVTGNTVSGNNYTPKSYVACGLIWYQAAGVKASNNTLFANEKDLCNVGKGGGQFIP